MTNGIDYTVRLNIKVRSIVKSTVKVLEKHLLIISLVNLIISLCYNYIINFISEEQINIVAYLLRGTFVSSIPSCIVISLLIICKEHYLSRHSYSEWNILTVICIILTFYSINFTKGIFTKEPITVYDVIYMLAISYILQNRFNKRKLKTNDYQFYVNPETINFFELLQKGTIINIVPFLFSYIVSFTVNIFLTVVKSVSITILLSILTHPFEMILNLPKIYNLTNLYLIENFSFIFSIISSIWITTLMEYHFMLYNFVFNKYDCSIITTLTNFPVHNKAPYDEEFLVVACIYNYLKDISYQIKGTHIEITNMDKRTKLKLLLFKKLMLINAILRNREDTSNILSHLCNPINTVLFEDTQIWNSYVESCMLCVDNLIDQFKKLVNILNHDETLYTYEEKSEIHNLFEKKKIMKLKDTIKLTCLYFKGISLWTVTISIICKDLITPLVRRMSSMLVGLSFALFDFLNFVKISELYKLLHLLLYEMNGLIEIFKFYKEDILDNKYQYSYNLYKGLSYLFRNQGLKY